MSLLGLVREAPVNLGATAASRGRQRAAKAERIGSVLGQTAKIRNTARSTDAYSTIRKVSYQAEADIP